MIVSCFSLHDVDKNVHLAGELTSREEDIAAMQHEVDQLTNRINTMNQEHAQQIGTVLYSSQVNKPIISIYTRVYKQLDSGIGLLFI